MPNTKTIGGLQRGPDFDRDVYEPVRVERVEHEQRAGRRRETNDPMIRAAIEAGREVGEALTRDVQDTMGRELEEATAGGVEQLRAAQEGEGEVVELTGQRQVGDAVGRKVDVEYDTESQTIVITLISPDGEEVIRRVPPEEMIRTAQRLKENRAQMLENIM